MDKAGVEKKSETVEDKEIPLYYESRYEEISSY